jgi:probable rRNA maturation factor
MISIELNQAILKGGQKVPLKLVKKVAAVVSRQVRLKKKWTVSLAFVSDKKIKELNSIYRGQKSVTDVLSFNLEKESGEIVISYNRAKKQAKDQHHSTRNEIVFLMVHGLLHLQGHDHESEKDAKKMFTLQGKILKKLGVNPKI